MSSRLLCLLLRCVVVVVCALRFSPLLFASVPCIQMRGRGRQMFRFWGEKKKKEAGSIFVEFVAVVRPRFAA